IHIPWTAFEQLSTVPNIVSMKDSHRSPMEFMGVQKFARGKISIFTNQLQYYPYATWGARGFWSTAAWMGPWPLLYYRDVVDSGDFAKAEEVLWDISGGRAHGAGADEEGAPQDNARK